MGPMTGRGAGYCGGRGMAGGMDPGGRGRGGRGYRHMFHATGLTGWQRAAAAAQTPQSLSPAGEFEMLKAQAEAAAATLEQVRQRIDALTAKTDAPVSDQ